MEKFRVFLEVLQKYHFWILCGLIVLLSFVSWFLATSDEEQRFLARKSQIEKQLGLVNAIANNAEHPSAKFIKEIHDRESGTLASQVASASTHLYSEQRNANPLPQVFPNPTYQAEFKAEFEKIWRPMEQIASLPSGQLPELYRSRYRDHIQDHFPKLLGLIEQRKMPEPVAGGGEQPTQPIGIVDWSDGERKIKAFLERLSGATPTTLDIAMAQEDLWVYETLLKVIHNTNDVGPDPKHDPKNYQKPPSHKVARIKQILEMNIGKDAVQSWSKCEKALFNLPNEGGGDSAASAGGGDAPAIPGAAPLVGRYVDDKGKPLLDPTRQLPTCPEFRMMPIDLKVFIEQKDIPRLLAECANSAMRIDVRAVRILGQEVPADSLGATDASSDAAPPSTPADAGSAAQAPPPPPTTGRRPRQDPSRGRTKKAGGAFRGYDEVGGSQAVSVYGEESADPVYPPVLVEVQGIIYIYNPPRYQNPGTATPATPGAPGAPGTPATTTNPVQGPAATAAAAGEAPTNPRANVPGPGARP
ncbi:MAG: hypothetical protein ACLP9L_06105 [Thermoguttaceae bacterium]